MRLRGRGIWCYQWWRYNWDFKFCWFLSWASDWFLRLCWFWWEHSYWSGMDKGRDRSHFRGSNCSSRYHFLTRSRRSQNSCNWCHYNCRCHTECWHRMGWDRHFIFIILPDRCMPCSIRLVCFSSSGLLLLS